MRLDGLGSGVGDQVLKVAIWEGGTFPDTSALLATSDEVTVIDGSAAADHDFAFSSPVVLQAGDY